MQDDTANPAVPAADWQGFQFSLRSLLVFMAALSATLALLVNLKVPTGFGVFFVLWAVIPIWCFATARTWKGRIGWPTMALLLPLLIAPQLRVARGPTRPGICANQMRNVAIAVCRYASDHGALPPAYIADATGKPMHSWRVLILPELGYKALYDQYDFNEPWDGPNNRKLWNQMPPIYCCPSDTAGSMTTSYVAVVGPRTIWPGSVGVKLDEITDGRDKTILFMEVSNSGINWLEPRDLPFDQIVARPGSAAGAVPRSGHAAAFNIAFADGSVRFITDSLPSDTLKAMLTRDSREDVDPNHW